LTEEQETLAADDVLLHDGIHDDPYRKLGAHPTLVDGVLGTRFAVWAPNAERVSVIGAFNQWDKGKDLLDRLGESGLWEGVVPGVERGAIYKYHVVSHYEGYHVDKADPIGLYHEVPPGTGSIVWDLNYEWGDADWMETRAARNSCAAPISIYELHLGSWRRPAEGFPTYREIAPQLTEYVADMGFTHVEFLPLTEHPFYGSWGYQPTGYFAPTSRYGTPQDLMFLIDTLHQAGIGVILDWVPGHFPSDEHGLGFFDGTHLYEHMDPRQGRHPDWGSLIFNYDRSEVRSFLVSSAFFWLDKYHVDGLRVDAVASMLYVDFSRREGEWIPNIHGGKENLGAIEFIRTLNTEVKNRFPDALMIAEDNSDWPKATAPVTDGGLGFDLKWSPSWVDALLRTMHREPRSRRGVHGGHPPSAADPFVEAFVLSLSHDEVVDGKGSLLGQMPGEAADKLASLRLLLGFVYAYPGRKLLFMGGEIGVEKEWHHDEGLDWGIARSGPHADLQAWVRELNRFYRARPELHEDTDRSGFAWVDQGTESGVVSFFRRAEQTGKTILVVCNLTSRPSKNYRVGVPEAGAWSEVFGTHPATEDSMRVVSVGPTPMHGFSQSLSLNIPPQGMIFLAPQT
jgi:1,4-alpha-glucan branching enzyme